MAAPRIHIVGGFLGSGKTTAIAAAARQLIAAGKKVGVITNDQGRYLVDTLFFRSQDVPAVEVTGGCFCCNYDDFEERLAALDAAAHPDFIFAESVGSCADVVATVVKPLLELGPVGFRHTGFSVFTDSRLIRQRISGNPMPFSADVVYIFDKQLEEAGCIVINKADLLGSSEREQLLGDVSHEFPGKQVVMQNSLNAADVADWIHSIESGSQTRPGVLQDIDYERYGAGEAVLAWLDKSISLQVESAECANTVIDLIAAIAQDIRSRGWPIGHLKFIVQSGDSNTKISFTTVHTPGWERAISEIGSGSVSILINARVETAVDELASLVDKHVVEMAQRPGIFCRTVEEDGFHPGFPRPTHRMTSDPGT